MKKSVVIVEDDLGLQGQLELILKKKGEEIDCLYSVSSGEEALRRIPANPPDVVLMDIMLPKISGIECVAELKKVCPQLEIIMLTIYDDSENIFRALKAGASGYLIKSNSPEVLLQAIRDVSRGGAPFSSHIARKILQYFQLSDRSSAEKEKLSPREKEVIDLLAEGYIYKEISDKLSIGLETVRTHVKNICVKMHVRNRVEAVAKYRN